MSEPTAWKKSLERCEKGEVAEREQRREQRQDLWYASQNLLILYRTAWAISRNLGQFARDAEAAGFPRTAGATRNFLECTIVPFISREKG